jgi:hypothetical protein
MSGEGPESIPTSADPRSKRPTKKRALSPRSAQAATLDALFARPDQEIRLPDPERDQQRRRAAPLPEIVSNVQGSSAGAGSGEFHVYKAARRREYERLRLMDEEVAKERQAADFESAKKERESKDDEKTRKNRAKREKKMKARQKAKVPGTEQGPGKEQGKGLVAREVTMRDGEGDEDEPDTSVNCAAPVNTVQESGLVIHDDD